MSESDKPVGVNAERSRGEARNIRLQSVVALCKTGGSLSVAPLIEALNDPDTDVCCTAAIGLGKIGDVRAIAPLLKAATRKTWLGDCSVHALCCFGEPCAIACRILTETSFTPKMRIEMLPLLANVFPEFRRSFSDVRSFCTRLLHHNEEAIRNGAASVLMALQGTTLLRPCRRPFQDSSGTLLRAVQSGCDEPGSDALLRASRSDLTGAG